VEVILGEKGQDDAKTLEECKFREGDMVDVCVLDKDAGLPLPPKDTTKDVKGRDGRDAGRDSRDAGRDSGRGRDAGRGRDSGRGGRYEPYTRDRR
jgi:hypothetical protein